MLTLSQWRPRHLLATWIAYWIVLILAWLGPAIPLLLRMSRTGSHGTASLGANDGALSFVITLAGHTFVRAVGYGTLTVLMFVPPILFWLLWVAVRPRRVV